MSVEERDYPERVWLERDEETNEKRWFTVPGMGVEYALATRPEREAQEAVAWRAVAHPETGMGTMVNQIKYRLIEDADSLYGKGRWTLEELVPRLTPPDAAATIPRKAWWAEDEPPEGDGWERNVDAGRNGWERFDYHEES